MKRSLEQNRVQLREVFGHSADFHLEEVRIGNREGLVCYLSSMTDPRLISEQIVGPLSRTTGKDVTVDSMEELESFRKVLFSGTACQYAEFDHDVVWYVLSGYVVLIVGDLPCALAVFVNGIETRSIDEPSTQTIIRGPKDGFTECLDTNVSLIRRRVKNPRLRFEAFHIGKDTHTSVYIAYMEGVVNEKIVQEVRTRISRIQVSAVFDSGNIEELIQDKTMTVFPTVYNTERPDTAAANLIEGKVAIIVDGSPFVLLAPVVLTDFFTVSEDYYQPFMMAAFIRVIRYAAFLISLVTPAMWVAVITFHYELIPTTLLISIISQRESVPFPAVVEVLLMEMTFEVLREAGVRMPRAVGQALSIVGALVIGQAAVEAGIVSNMAVIIVSVTAISSFVAPIYSFATAARLLRFVLTFLAAFFGLYGVLLGLIAIVAHLASLRSFGAAYLASVAPFIVEDQKDVFLRFPIWAMRKRPSYLNTESPLKSPEAVLPGPPKKGGRR